MTEKRLAHHNVVAVVETLEDGRDAISGLRDAGLEDDELSLLGPEHAMRPGSGSISPEAGTTTTGGVGKATVAGIGTGAVGGSAVGAVAGLAVSAIPGVGLAAGAAALYSAVAGAAVGHIAGGLLGAETGGRKAMMWAQSLQPFVARVREEDRVLVGVHTEDPERADTAEERLRDLDPVEVIRLDADESFVPPGDRSAVVGRTVPSSVPDRPGAELGGRRSTDEDAAVGTPPEGEAHGPSGADREEPGAG